MKRKLKAIWLILTRKTHIVFVYNESDGRYQYNNLKIYQAESAVKQLVKEIDEAVQQHANLEAVKELIKK